MRNTKMRLCIANEVGTAISQGPSKKQVALKLGKRGQFPTRAVPCKHCLGKATGRQQYLQALSIVSTQEGPGGRTGLQSLQRVVIC